MYAWVFYRCLLNERCHRIDVVGQGCKTQPNRLKWNTATSCGRVQDHAHVSTSLRRDPIHITSCQTMRECTIVSVWVLYSFPSTARFLHSLSRRNWITMNTKSIQEGLSISIGRKDRCQHRRPRRHQWPTRPPDMQVVDRRKRGHGPAFPHAFLTQRRYRQPTLDQTGVGIRLVRHACARPKEEA